MNLQHFLLKNTHAGAWDELLSADQFPLDDEVIADIAINAMLLVMNNSTRPATKNGGTTIDDYAPLVAAGVRFPWKDRVALGQCIDTLNDVVPNYTAIGLTRHNNNSTYAQAICAATIPHAKLPALAKIALRGAKSIHRTTHIRGYDGLSRSQAGRGSKELESVVDGGYAGVMPDGFVIGVDDHGNMNTFFGTALAYAVSLHNDRRYFWEVTATEAFWDGLPAKAMFSIDVEYIKSLFYARSIPLTATGRLRPILHWVSAHKRRMKEGVDIDVAKHLRGIDKFEMHGVNFGISEPRKGEEK